MSLTILDDQFWSERLREAQELHHAIYKCPRGVWDQIAERHKKILSRIIDPSHSILDVGCGWGRLLDLLPPEWSGNYLGVDISQTFLDLARKNHPDEQFLLADLTKTNLREVSGVAPCYDWAILISIRPMVIRHLGTDAWLAMESNIQRVATKILFLEYDPEDLPTISWNPIPC